MIRKGKVGVKVPVKGNFHPRLFFPRLNNLIKGKNENQSS